MTFLKSIKKSMLLISLTYIAVGIYLCIYKEEGLTNVYLVSAIGLCVAGLLAMVRYFLINITERIKREDFIVGALLIAVGIVLYLSRKEIKYLTFIIFGIAMCISAMAKIQDMLDLLACGVKKKGVYFLLFLICGGLGALVMFSPFIITSVNYIITGVGLALCGITDLISNFYLAKAISRYEKAKLESNKIAEEDDAISHIQEMSSISEEEPLK